MLPSSSHLYFEVRTPSPVPFINAEVDHCHRRHQRCLPVPSTRPKSFLVSRMAGDNQAEEFHRELDSFLQSPRTTKNTKRVILDALKFRPAMAPIRDLLPADEVEERLAMATRVKRHDVATWRAIDVAILMTIPLDQLREVRPHTMGRIGFEQIECFVRSGRFRITYSLASPSGGRL